MAARNITSIEPVADDEAEYDLEAILRQREEAVGGREITFRWKGEVFTMPHPAFLSDELADEVDAVQNDSAELAIVMMGAEQYERFRALDGQGTYIGALFQAVAAATTDVDGEGRPTRFAPSSRAQRRALKRR